MKIKGKILSTKTINYNGDFVDRKSVENAIDDFVVNNKFTGYNGLFYFKDTYLENCAGKITDLYIDKNGIFIMEGITIDTPSGKELEEKIHNNENYSISLEAYYKDIDNKTFVEKIVNFIVMEQNSENTEWNINEINDETYELEGFEDELEDVNDIDQDKLNTSSNWWLKMTPNDIEQILNLSNKIIESHTKKECLEMSKQDYFKEILCDFWSEKLLYK